MGTVISSWQPFFQKSYFFRGKLLPSSHFLRICGCFEPRTSAQHQHFQKSYFLEKANSSEMQLSALPTSPTFHTSYFFRRATFLQHTFSNCIFSRIYASYLSVSNCVSSIPGGYSKNLGVLSCISNIAQNRVIDRVYLISRLHKVSTLYCQSVTF